MLFTTRILVGLTLGACAADVTHAETVNVYNIGNSLLWNSVPPQIDLISNNAPTKVHSGYNIRCGSTLYAAAVLENTCIPPTSEGPWREALAEYSWDYLIVQPFQPYIGSNATLANDTYAVETFVEELHLNPANLDTRVLIYQSWPFPDMTPSWDNWLSEAGSDTDHRHDYYDKLQASLASRGIAAEILPNTDILFHILNNLEQFDAFSSPQDLYGDGVHVSAAGAFVQAMTVLTYVNDVDLTGLPKGNLGGSLSDKARDQLQTAIWKIVNTVRRPGDFNTDGVVDLADNDTWAASYGTSAAGVDANLDGVVNAADYTIWRDAAARTASLSVPEPAGFLIGLAPVGGLFFRRVAGRVHAA